ncbi:MAG TPA: acetolactate decarboxylase [Lachnospiraceae bacterium]|nr:acetolactate decarboxylase [Lachnospiraceae bacterium]
MKNSKFRKSCLELGLLLAMSVFMTGCVVTVDGKSAYIAPAPDTAEVSNGASADTDREVINQVSLLQGLTFGDYSGSVPVSRLRELGDTGIGTFDALNGELIMLDGTVYRAAYDGSVEEVADEETIPFSNVTFFDADEEFSLSGIDNVNTLKSELDAKVDELGDNRFYMIKATGSFTNMQVRSELPQTEPYKPLAEVLETDQTFFDYENIKGTVVGLYCPAYMNDLNAVGWHFHFVSDDRLYGGHVLDLGAEELDISIDRTDGFAMVLPDNDMFNNFDLTIDQSEDIKKVETGED